MAKEFQVLQVIIIHMSVCDVMSPSHSLLFVCFLGGS